MTLSQTNDLIIDCWSRHSLLNVPVSRLMTSMHFSMVHTEDNFVDCRIHIRQKRGLMWVNIKGDFLQYLTQLRSFTKHSLGPFGQIIRQHHIWCIN